MILAEQLSLSIGKKQILKDCSIALQPGVLTAVVGPNGAGKSSLLKIISGEAKRFEGQVWINGKNLLKISHRDLSRQRAVLAQSTSVNFPLTVAQIIEIGRFPHQTSNEENEQIITDILQRTGLTDFKQRIYQSLSGGEQQRVQLARVMTQIHEDTVFPKYIMLDEPTASLDIAQQHNMMQLVHAALTNNVGAVAVVHDINLALQYADEIIFMKEGKIIAQGNINEVCTKSNIEKTFSHPVEILKGRDGIVICPIPYHQPSSLNIISNYGKLNYH